MPPDDTSTPATPSVVAALPPRWVRPVLLVAAWVLGLVAVVDVTGAISLDHPMAVFHRRELPAFFFILLPTLLLHTLFCARRGAERGYAAETGMLPGLLLFGVLMFISGSVGRFVPHAPGLGLLLLAAFATTRTDPPAPPGTRLIWAGLAVVFGAWCVYVDSGAWGGVGALALYAGWSAWRGVGNRLPVTPARRVTGVLLLTGLMGVTAIMRAGLDFVIVPLSVAAGLSLLELYAPAPDCRAGGPPAA